MATLTRLRLRLSPRLLRPSSLRPFIFHPSSPCSSSIISPFSRPLASRTPPEPPQPSRYAFIKSLASKPSPTTLYEAPSHTAFYLGCWSSSLSILSWTLLTGPTVITQPVGTPPWVGLVFGASYAILASMGFYILSKTPRIVGRIRILPATTATTTTGPSSAAAAGLSMELTVKRMLPVLQPKIIIAPLDNISLKTRFSLPPELVPELRRLQEEAAAAQALRKFDMQHLLTMPFRRMARALVGFFRGVRAAWTGMGYGVIRVDGKEYKVDVTGGYAHDGFQTLERIVRIGN